MINDQLNERVTRGQLAEHSVYDGGTSITYSHNDTNIWKRTILWKSVKKSSWSLSTNIRGSICSAHVAEVTNMESYSSILKRVRQKVDCYSHIISVHRLTGAKGYMFAWSHEAVHRAS